MIPAPNVLIVDDQLGDINWLIDLIQSRGYVVVLATNEQAARQQLEAVKEGKVVYALAIIDIMVAIKDLMDISLNDEFFEESRNTGIRLCRYARRDLSLLPETLPIISITSRNDLEEVKREMRGLSIRSFHRTDESIRSFIEKHLPLARS